MKENRYKAILPRMVMILMVLMGIASNGFAQDSDMDRVKELLEQTALLTPGEGQVVAQMVEDIMADTNRLEELWILWPSIIQRVNYGKESLDSLLSRFEGLARDMESRKIAKIEIDHFQDCRDRLKQLGKDMAKYQKLLQRADWDADPEYAAAVVRDQVALLVGRKDVTSVSSVWQAIRNAAKSPYHYWNLHYRDLVQELIKRRREVGHTTNALNFKEEKFMKDFNPLREEYRKLSLLEPESF